MPVKEDHTTSFSIGTHGHHYERVYRTGQDTPLRIRRKGSYQENSYYAEFITDKSAEIELVSGFGTSFRKATSVQSASFASVPSPTYNDILPNLGSNWRNSDFNAAVTIGEGRQTVGLLTDTLGRVGRSVRALRRGNFRELYSILPGRASRGTKNTVSRLFDLQQYSSAWLELRYGWRPLINDIYNLSEAIKLKGNSNSVNASSNHERPYYVNIGPYFNEVDDRLKENRRAMYIKVHVSRAPTFIERWGLNNPATVAWELVPYSFVVDWFVPIGSYIASLHVLGNLPVTKVVITTVFERERIGAVQIGTQVPGVGIVQATGHYKHSTFIMNRQVTGALPSAFSVLSQVPSSIQNRPDFDVKRIIDATALLYQRFRSLGR